MYSLPVPRSSSVLRGSTCVWSPTQYTPTLKARSSPAMQGTTKVTATPSTHTHMPAMVSPACCGLPRRLHMLDQGLLNQWPETVVTLLTWLTGPYSERSARPSFRCMGKFCGFYPCLTSAASRQIVDDRLKCSVNAQSVQQQFVAFVFQINAERL